ncbi:MAG: type II toxin-antitoxin system VapC family toxin [Pirellulales bacterium]
MNDRVVYRLDTDTAVFALRGRGSVVRALSDREDEPIAISVITLGELLAGSRRSPHPAVEEQCVRLFCDGFPICPVSESVYALSPSPWSNGSWISRRDFPIAAGRPATSTCWIAATAMALDLSLVTNNERHFRRVQGLAVENGRN